MNPIHLPGFRLLPGLALSIGGTPGRVTLGSGGVLLWSAEDGGPGYIAGIDWYIANLGDLSKVELIPGDPSTGGCLVHLLGGEAWRVKFDQGYANYPDGPWMAFSPDHLTAHRSQGSACVAVAVALGRWPG